jgi:hypothetical protein
VQLGKLGPVLGARDVRAVGRAHRVRRTHRLGRTPDPD